MRLVLRGVRDPASLPRLEGQLRCDFQNGTATLVMRDWDPERLEGIARETGAVAECDPLTLEDIFLAVHA